MTPEPVGTATQEGELQELQTATLAAYIHSPLVSLGSNARLRAATRVMQLHDIGAIAVIDDGNFVGLLGEGDVVRAVAAGADPDAAMVGAWMTSPPVSAHPEERLVDAVTSMLHARVRCLPVIGARGHRIGFVRLEEIQLPILHAETAPEHRLPYMPPD